MLLVILYCQLFFGNFQKPPATFTRQIIDDRVAIGYGLAIGDVDGDGKPDILLADKKQFVWYRNGDWKRFVMVDSLTASDHVCIAARDLDGDGKVEVAVGAQWNPGETTDSTKSGSVHYLVRPSDVTQRWKPVQLHHEPTVHRMKWVRAADGKFFLVVAPLHGRGNRGGEGAGARILAYAYPKNVQERWATYILDSSMHLTHNFDVTEYRNGKKTEILLAGKEGVKLIREPFNSNVKSGQPSTPAMLGGKPTGEIRRGRLAGNREFIACIEPMHGSMLNVQINANDLEKVVVLEQDFKEGHALAVADFSGNGNDQVVMGWRIPDKDGKVGIKLYSAKDNSGTNWDAQWIDENGMACEDLQVADMNEDGKPDIIASGRATRNLVIYWNK
jgi:hypothetical protein